MIAPLALACLAPTVAAHSGPQEPRPPLSAPPPGAVRLGGWLGGYGERLRTISLPALVAACEESGRLANFDRAAEGASGGHSGGPGADADVYRLVAAVERVLAGSDAPELARWADDAVRRIAAAQREDGYLHTYSQLEGRRPFVDLRDGRELHCAAELVEAAIARDSGRGKSDLLDVALRLAERVEHELGPRQRIGVPGHPGIESALARLSEHAGEERWLDLAYALLERRGSGRGRALWGPEWQDVLPVRKYRRATGDPARAAALLRGAVDVHLARRDPELLGASIDAFGTLLEEEAFVTGGVGRVLDAPEEVPLAEAASETCASVELARWCERLLLATRQAAYGDALERLLLNAVLSGVSADGRRFARWSPLVSGANGDGREPWTEPACCQTSLAAYLADLGRAAYAHGEDEVYVVLYGESEAVLPLGVGPVRVAQRTDFPWSGRVEIEVSPQRPAELALHVRVPEWSGDRVGYGWGKVTADATVERGSLPGVWLTFERRWSPGDVLVLELPFETRRIAADPQRAGRVAVARGPVVHCVEVEGGLEGIALAADAELVAEPGPERLRGAPVLRARAREASGKGAGGGWTFWEEWDSGRGDDGDVGTEGGELDLELVPYALRGARGPAAMAVWIPEAESRAEEPEERGASPGGPAATLRASHLAEGDTISALVDGLVPERSSDTGVARATFLDHRGTKEWIELEYAEPRSADTLRVFWCDDGGEEGGCRVPLSWRLFWRDGEEWRPVELAGGSFFWTFTDRWCEVEFEPVTTSALRLELQLRPEASAGLFEIEVGGP